MKVVSKDGVSKGEGGKRTKGVGKGDDRKLKKGKTVMEDVSEDEELDYDNSGGDSSDDDEGVVVLKRRQRISLVNRLLLLMVLQRNLKFIVSQRR